MRISVWSSDVCSSDLIAVAQLRLDVCNASLVEPGLCLVQQKTPTLVGDLGLSRIKFSPFLEESSSGPKPNLAAEVARLGGEIAPADDVEKLHGHVGLPRDPGTVVPFPPVLGRAVP